MVSQAIILGLEAFIQGGLVEVNEEPQLFNVVPMSV